MASDGHFAFIYQDVSTDILCGPLQQQLEDPAVLMLSQPHEQQHGYEHQLHQQQLPHTKSADFSDVVLQSGSSDSTSSSSFLSPTSPPHLQSHPSTTITNNDIEKRTTNGEISPETCWASPSLETAPTSRRRSRTSPLSNPARRAEHNATERARRESLNGKFRLLASILPNLQNSKKPSKSQIIEKALEWVEHSLLSEEKYQYELFRLDQEYKKISDQLQQCLISSQQQQQQWPLSNTPPLTDSSSSSSISHSNSSSISSVNFCNAVPSPPSSITSTSVSSSRYSCASNSSNNNGSNVTQIMVTPSATTVDVSLIPHHPQQHHHRSV